MARDKADIIVVGAGIFGLWTAYAALARGLSVLVLEAGPQVGHGASGGIVGALAPHMPERWGDKKQFQFEALTVLGDALKTVERESGLPTGYGRVGRLVPLMDEIGRERALSRIADAKENWGTAARMQILPPDAFPDWLHPQAAPAGIVHDDLTGRLHPHLTCLALAEAIRRGGGVIETGCTVTAVHSGSVQTDQGARQAQAIVLAAGVAGFDLMSPLVGEVPGRAEKGQAALLDMDMKDVPLIYADGLYLIGHAGCGVAIGATSERHFEGVGPDALLDDVIARACAISPRLAQARVVRRWAGLRPRANGRDPMLGAVPGTTGIYAALGAFKIGFGIGQKVGQVLLDEIMEGRIEMPDSFRVAAHLGR